MNYLLDTNTWSHLQRGDPRVLANIRRLPEEATICMPVIAAGELLAGVESLPDGKRKEELRRLYRELLGRTTEVIEIGLDVAEWFATVVGQLRRDGRPIETNDVWIAAIALARGFTVVTNDADFGYVTGLAVEDWTAGPAD